MRARLLLSVLALAVGCSQRGVVGTGAEVDAGPAVDGGPGADAGPSCDLACRRGALCLTDDDDGAFLPACLDGCDDPGSRAVILACDAMRDGCAYPAMCGFGDPLPRDACAEECDRLGFRDCIADADVPRCVGACETATADEVQRFVQCADADICEDDACYRIFFSEGSVDVPACRDACDTMAFFDCISAAELTDCRAVCARTTSDASRTFEACAQSVCDGPDCYDELVAATF